MNENVYYTYEECIESEVAEIKATNLTKIVTVSDDEIRAMQEYGSAARVLIDSQTLSSAPEGLKTFTTTGHQYDGLTDTQKYRHDKLTSYFDYVNPTEETSTRALKLADIYQQIWADAHTRAISSVPTSGPLTKITARPINYHTALPAPAAQEIAALKAELAREKLTSNSLRKHIAVAQFSDDTLNPPPPATNITTKAPIPFNALRRQIANVGLLADPRDWR